MGIHCCETIREQLEYKCSMHSSSYECPDVLVTYNPQFREYGLIVHDGGTSSLEIKFCPWCGFEFLPSLRDRWFQELSALGFDEPIEQAIPEKYKSDAWHASA